jgi:sulfoxide reductase heme-binding subunit YedZ
MFGPAIWLISEYEAGEFGTVPLGGLTYWSGVWATALLLLALAVTPAMTILRWRRLILVRRMIGVTALVYTVAHLFIYFALRFWNVSNIAYEMVTRLSLIVASVSTLGLVALGATSLDMAVARMGAAGWNRLHNTVYVITALAVIHYLLSPGVFPDQYLVSGLFFWLIAWRRLNRRGLGRDPVALMLLAVCSALFAVVLEAGWVWAYHGYEPLGTLRNNLSLDLGLAPAWKILVLGLLIAVVPAAGHAFRAGSGGFGARRIG